MSSQTHSWITSICMGLAFGFALMAVLRGIRLRDSLSGQQATGLRAAAAISLLLTAAAVTTDALGVAASPVLLAPLAVALTFRRGLVSIWAE